MITLLKNYPSVVTLCVNCYAILFSKLAIRCYGIELRCAVPVQPDTRLSIALRFHCCWYCHSYWLAACCASCVTGNAPPFTWHPKTSPTNMASATIWLARSIRFAKAVVVAAVLSLCVLQVAEISAPRPLASRGLTFL